ncbi:hypothetical protein, partial [Haloferula sp.]|uniref:hypothetical protein n=1 Tax=Haloferula sp. TaxID=2497595 RepID=UPI003C71749B
STAEESPVDLAKRVIADKSQAFTTIDIEHAGVVSAEVRDPKEETLIEASKEAERTFETYMLGDSVPEDVRIAYAIRLLAAKWIPTKGAHQYGFGKFDKEKNDQFLRDALALSARLAEIKQAEPQR